MRCVPNLTRREWARVEIDTWNYQTTTVGHDINGVDSVGTKLTRNLLFRLAKSGILSRYSPKRPSVETKFTYTLKL